MLGDDGVAFLLHDINMPGELGFSGRLGRGIGVKTGAESCSNTLSREGRKRVAAFLEKTSELGIGVWVE